MSKSHACGDLRETHVGQEVTLAGWVHRRRDHGGLIFLDLRDRFGLVQVVADPDNSPQAHADLDPVRSEWVVQVVGRVRLRPEGMENTDLVTGMVEVVAESVKVLNAAKTPPFLIKRSMRCPSML